MGGAASVSGCKVEALSSKSAEEVAKIIADLGEVYVGYSRLFYSNGISGEVVFGLIVSGDPSEIDSYFEELGVKSKLHRRVITSAFYRATEISVVAPVVAGEVAAAPHVESPVQLLPRVPTAQELRVVIEPDVERILDTMPPIECEWRCKAHSSLTHDIFINYRVACDKDFASTLYYGLSTIHVKWNHDGSAIRPFLDQVCLRDGENWEQGFLNGLRSSTLILLLISEAAVEGIRKANNRPDNVLLEYECALELQKTNNVAILPLLIGQYVNVNGQELFRKFNAFDCNVYPDERHCHVRAQRARRAVSVRATMKQLFSLQGIQVDPRNMGAVLAAVEQRFAQAKQDSVLRSHVAWKQKRADARKRLIDNPPPAKVLPADYVTKKAQNEASRSDTDEKISRQFVDIIQSSQDVKELKKLYASGKVDVDFPGAYGYSGLHFCAYYEYPEVAKYLLSLGADCDKIESYSNQTPLQQAKGRKSQKMVDILKPYTTEEKIESEIDTLLSNAAGEGNIAEVTRLLQLGADPDFLNPAYYHYAALHRAMYQATDGAPQILSVLLEYGADGSMKEGYGHKTPMQFAQDYNKTAAIEILKLFKYTE